MTAAITLAGPDHLTSVLTLMERCHLERALPYDDAHREAVIAPLLQGSPLGAIWTVGPARAPLGYVLITFGWSLTQGGMVGWVEDIYVRPSVRKRGIGTEVLHAVSLSLREAGVKALHTIAPADNADVQRFCTRVGFQQDADSPIMTDVL
jgi:GNAT superfamily N-acetyltransferase